MEITFKVGGRQLHLDRREVIRKLRGVHPETVRTHAVEVSGILYPVKQAFSLVTGLDVLDFNTNQARNEFRRLGFIVRRIR
jgi:hypothetical protein